MANTDAITSTALPDLMVGDGVMFLTQSGLRDASIFNDRFIVTESIGWALQRDAQHTQLDS